MLGRVAGVRDAVHAEEVRRINHGRDHITVLSHGYDVLPVVRKIDGALPRHDSEDVEREQGAGRVNLGIGAIEEIGDHFRALHLRWMVGMLGLIVESGIFLVAFGGKADVVELHFIDSGLGYKLGQGDVIVLDFGIRGVGQTSLPFSRQLSPVRSDLTASSGWLVTRCSSRKMAMRAMACMFSECRKWMSLGRSEI